MSLKIIVLKIVITVIKLVSLISFGLLMFRKVVDIISDFTISNLILFLIQVVVVVLAFLFLMVYLEYLFSYLGLPIKFKSPVKELRRRLLIFKERTNKL